jgi:hypothetical protein
MRFGRLEVVRLANSTGKAQWKCVCDCGKSVVVPSNNLVQGHTNSCGCMALEIRSMNHKTHGLSHTPLFRVWCSMRARCENPKNTRYDRYGGRGIVVCDRWRNSFLDFYNDVVSGYANGLQLDRIDNDGNYEPTNTRWVPPAQNARNSKVCKLSEADAGLVRSLLEIADCKTVAQMFDVHAQTIRSIMRNKAWAGIDRTLAY